MQESMKKSCEVDDRNSLQNLRFFAPTHNLLTHTRRIDRRMTCMIAILAQTQQPPLAPTWLVLPLALLALVVVGAHWIVLGRAQGMPPIRKSLRSANGLVMMTAIPILAYGFGIVSPSNGRAFALTWILATGFLLIVLLIAGVDLLYTAYLARKEYSELRDEFRKSKPAKTQTERRSQSDSSSRS